MRIAVDVPDRYWYGEKPRLIKGHKGVGVEELIEAVEQAARAYPWITTYRAFPGPNSNTFTAWIARKVPELELDLTVHRHRQRFCEEVGCEDAAHSSRAISFLPLQEFRL